MKIKKIILALTATICISSFGSNINSITADAAATQVANVKAASNESSVKITWDKYSGANGYIVELRGSSGNILRYSKGYSTPNNYLTFSNLSENTTYIFTVKAVKKKSGSVLVTKVTDLSQYTILTNTTSIRKATQKYQLYNAQKGKNVFTDVTCTKKNTPAWDQDQSSGLKANIKVTGVKDEIHNCVKVQMNYQNFYIKTSDVTVLSGGTTKILPTGGISQICDVKDYTSNGSYKNKYWCGCGPTSVTMLIDWEQNKGKARNTVINDAGNKKVDVLGSGYTFYNNKTNSCWGLKASGMTQLLKYETGKTIKMDAIKNSQSQATNQIKAILNKDHRIIAGVSPAGTWGHYVVITGYYVKNNVTHFVVADPLYSDKNINNISLNTDTDKNTSHPYYSLCDYTDGELYKLLNKARNCSKYTQYNSANLAYLWYIA